MTAHPLATTATLAGIIILACTRFKLKLASFGCGRIASYITDGLNNALETAADQNACLRVTFRLRVAPPSSPLVFAADNSSRCKA